MTQNKSVNAAGNVDYVVIQRYGSHKPYHDTVEFIDRDYSFHEGLTCCS